MFIGGFGSDAAWGAVEETQLKKIWLNHIHNVSVFADSGGDGI